MAFDYKKEYKEYYLSILHSGKSTPVLMAMSVRKSSCSWVQRL